ncbi:MAG TPA: UDP-N-acetylmuramate--L-alanine ligase [Candidatus Gallibacteroides avistercoris]|uniref:UDP-N-acetylmuramate--L-alanine ligase n=1 Tax=Candidatus Gallibacteroides avistercoris TaxID=2840833 RepID=A0A9D1M614_9BACT|nr:UDP-N-acetylmuramate--L-alanine ligase [Candidatus Gallibacteroides avistercoris]
MINYTSLYFVGAGGIGMSALVRYFLAKGYPVAGYDKTPSELTEKLLAEGAEIVYDESVSLIPSYCRDARSTLVVRTPAVPDTHAGLSYFRENGFTIVKRAELLGLITRSSQGLCFAGTHGKTTTSSMAAHIFHQSGIGCNAFLGGILKNYDSNLILDNKSPYSIIEADEYDRSFHHLSPYMAVITATDPDHLDIYGTREAYLESFSRFTSLIRPGGCLVMHKGIAATPRTQEGVKVYEYAGNEESDFYARNIRIGNGEIVFDFVTPREVIPDISLGVPVQINIENGVAAMAIAWLNGIPAEAIRQAMASFKGAKRRFDYWLKTDKCVLIDDYAHHPDEIRASIQSVRALYPDKKISAIFQPHLYSRTRDFAGDFAKALSLLDELILTEIYPAREQPIPGVTSQIILDQVTCKEKELCEKKMLLEKIKERNFEVLITLGAGDIDRLLPDIKAILETK